ncbi:hypothetical protein [Streptomyces sp. ScaeMP-e122]|uniref:hypothetical protein n=1 Tax=Streptomyces sp. SID8358 TaxID=2690342 RepID=UPI000DB1BD1A
MILTRGARTTGAVLCAVLGIVVACWIVRDLRAMGDPVDLVRHWAGYADARPAAPPVTTQTDAVLLVVYAAVLFTVARSPVAAAALVSTGVVTLALRLPSVWTVGASWTDGRYSDVLRTRALVGTFVVLAAALALIVTGAAGRRPPVDAYEPLPTRPGRGARAAAFVALGASAAVLVAWEVRQFVTLPSGVYPDRLVGGRAVLTGLTDAPPGWGALALAAVCLVVAWTALLGAVHSRPLGMIAGGFLLLQGSFGAARAVHHELLVHFGELQTEYRLVVATSFFQALAGAVALLALSREGLADPGGPDPVPGGYGYPPAGSSGYGYPSAGPGYAGPPGYGRPQPGGPGDGPPPPGPPPPGPPPPGW